MTEVPLHHGLAEHQAAYGGDHNVRAVCAGVSVPLRLGDDLLQRRTLTPEQLHLALREQSLHGGLLGRIIVRLGFMADADLARIMAVRTGLPYIAPEALQPDVDVPACLPVWFQEQHICLPLFRRGDRVEVAVADPLNVPVMDQLRRYFVPDFSVDLLVAAPSALQEVLARRSSLDRHLDQVLHNDGTGEDEIVDAAWRPPVVRFVDAVLVDAVYAGASDIHMEPEATLVRLRYRVHGQLQERHRLHKASWPEISYRLKIMAGMNIAETRRMQDGRFSQTVGGASIDFRVSTMPVTSGETIVIRVLDQRKAQWSLDQLGFEANVQNRLWAAAQRTDGLVLLTGPTGCGKTTTLYALLKRLGQQPINIMTLEEPVEYDISGLRQTQINASSGFNFSDGVRGLLRQDPDVILIGEIRDPDTAHMALRAAMTGHRVFSTLHCRDSLSALPRLLDMGVSHNSLAGHLSAVVAQRLVPTLCPHCATPVHPDAEQRRSVAMLSPEPLAQLFEAAGCPQCRHTGIGGRVVVAETLVMTPELEAAWSSGVARAELLALARQQGFTTMQEDAWRRLVAGQISLASLMAHVPMMGGG